MFKIGRKSHSGAKPEDELQQQVRSWKPWRLGEKCRNQAWGRRSERARRWRGLREKGEQHMKDASSGCTFLPGAGLPFTRYSLHKTWRSQWGNRDSLLANYPRPAAVPLEWSPFSASSSPAFLMMYSASKLNKQGDNITKASTFCWFAQPKRMGGAGLAARAGMGAPFSQLESHYDFSVGQC